MSSPSKTNTSWPSPDATYYEPQSNKRSTSIPPPPRAFCRQQSIASVASSHNITGPDGNSTNNKANSSKLIKSKKDLLVIISMAMILFFGLCAFSVIAPFFTLEGKKKGVSTSVTGLIFAVYPLVVFILSPFIGKYLPVIGPKFCLIAGVFLEAGSQVLFGFVEDLPSGYVFITYCFVIRVVTALGSAMSQTATLSIMAITFKENMSTVFGMLELFSGLGLMAGPALGGVLYKVGGFKLPFLVIGSALLLALFSVFWILPSDQELLSDGRDIDSSTNEEPQVGSITGILRVPGVFMLSIVTITAGMVLSFLDPTLTNHLQDISDNGLSSEQIGLYFLIAASVYTLSAPPLGYLTDKKIDGRKAIIFGHFFVFASYFFLGPCPLIKDYVKPRLWLAGVSLAVMGFGIAPFVIPNLADMQKCATNAGLPDSLAVKSILSGLFGSCFSVGSVLGPTIGGFLTDHLSFDWASAIFSFVVLLEGVVLIIFTIWERNSKWVKKRVVSEEHEPLLPNC